MRRFLIGIVSSTLMLSGCGLRPPLPDDPHYAPTVPHAQNHETPIDGSLYTMKNGYSLYSDIKAYEVGDVITVVLDETTNATVHFDTDMTRDVDIAVTNPTILGSALHFPKTPGVLPLENNTNNNLAMDLDSDVNVNGDSDSNQNNRLSGTISVTVQQVLPNDNLVVRGEKWFYLNKGEEYIRLSGIIRPQDVRADNSIQSSRVADARLHYGGTGALANNTGPGWLVHVISSVIWPF